MRCSQGSPRWTTSRARAPTLNTPLDDPSPEHRTAARQELRQVSALIEALPAKCREAFTLRKLQGLSQREVAGRMGISESTVEKHIGRALRTLMEAMKDSGNMTAGASEVQERPIVRVHAKTREQRRN
jgi:RNA polymerase sigma-70 factor (ECF subfamily)